MLVQGFAQIFMEGLTCIPERKRAKLSRVDYTISFKCLDLEGVDRRVDHVRHFWHFGAQLPMALLVSMGDMRP